MAGPSNVEFKSAKDLLDDVFEEKLAHAEYDAEVVRLAKEHLTPPKLPSKAGVKLAEALVELARQRAQLEPQ